MSSNPLPSNPDAERYLLGKLLADESVYPLVAAAITADDFSLEGHRRIWRAAVDLYDRGSQINAYSVGLRLNEQNLLESVGGLTYISSLDDGTARVFDCEPYIRTVKDCSIRRRLILALQKTISDLQIGGSDSGEVAERAQSFIREVQAERSETGGSFTPTEVIDAAGGLEGLLSPKRDKTAIMSPFPSLNRMTGGFGEGELVIIAARPSAGKSAMAMQIAEHSSARGTGVILFSQEMSNEEIMRRMVCGQAGISTLALRRGVISGAERNQIIAAANTVSRYQLLLNDRVNMTVPAMHAIVRQTVATRQVRLMVVDYLQLLSGSGRYDNRVQEVSSISRGLKLLAKEFKICVIALSQLNRANQAEKRRPQLSDLRDSGSIEQDADTVLLIHRESNENPEATLIVAKQRNGPLGDIPMMFASEVTRFYEITDREAA